MTTPTTPAPAPAPAPAPDTLEQWLTVQQACALIGVAPATLRRWSAAGDVPAFTTPGGHRRFARSTILGMLPATHQPRPNLQRLGETAQHMTDIFRRQLVQVFRGAAWLERLDEDQVEALRHNSRAITASLLEIIDEPTPARHQTLLVATMASAADCGRIAAKGSAGIGETVQTFLRLRALFLAELVAMSRRRGLDTVAATDLLATASEAIDQLHVAVISGHQAETARSASTRGTS
jgi:excisionase family DNA binding protein